MANEIYSVGDILLIEVQNHQRRLEYIDDNILCGVPCMSWNWCPLSRIPQMVQEKGWKLTKVGTIADNPQYMNGRSYMYLEAGWETALVERAPILSPEIRTEILKKINQL